MLDRLRRHAAGFGTKVILGMMTAGLLFYFGYAGVRKAERGGTVGGGHHAIAQVNGEGIPEGQFQTLYDNQLKFYEQLTKGSTPPALLESVKQNVLQKLIQNKIFSQQAKALGLSVSDKELIHDITSDPKLSENGVFNKKYYLDVFKPSFERQTGEDYETLLREELLAEKFENLIRNSVSVTEAEVKQEYLLSNTQLNLEKISLDPAQFKEDAENKKKEAETEILAALKEKAPPKGPSPLDAVKKKYELKVEETGLHPLRDKVAFVGVPDAHDALECIVKLSEENPVCPAAYKIGDQLVLFKLKERKDADWDKFAEQKEPLAKALTARRQPLMVKQISDALMKQANIHVYLKNPG